MRQSSVLISYICNTSEIFDVEKVTTIVVSEYAAAELFEFLFRDLASRTTDWRLERRSTATSPAVF